MNEKDVFGLTKVFGKPMPEQWSVKEHMLVAKAYTFATKAHEGITRKGTTIPYITHPIEAASIVMTMTDDVDVIAAALLHDVVEDTEYTLADIQERFGERIAELVAEETENKRQGLPSEQTWRIRKEETIQGLGEASIEAKIIALGDKLSNIRSIDRDYEAIGDALWQRFHQKEMKEHGWYYSSIVLVTKELSDTQAWKEYEALCRKVFGE